MLKEPFSFVKFCLYVAIGYLHCYYMALVLLSYKHMIKIICDFFFFMILSLWLVMEKPKPFEPLNHCDSIVLKWFCVLKYLRQLNIATSAGHVSTWQGVMPHSALLCMFNYGFACILNSFVFVILIRYRYYNMIVPS